MSKYDFTYDTTVSVRFPIPNENPESEPEFETEETDVRLYLTGTPEYNPGPVELYDEGSRAEILLNHTAFQSFSDGFPVLAANDPIYIAAQEWVDSEPEELRQALRDEVERRGEEQNDV